MPALDQAADDLRIAAQNFLDALNVERAALDPLHKAMLDAKDAYDASVNAYSAAYNRVITAADTLDEITKALGAIPTPAQQPAPAAPATPVTGPVITPPAVNDNPTQQPAA